MGIETLSNGKVINYYISNNEDKKAQKTATDTLARRGITVDQSNVNAGGSLYTSGTSYEFNFKDGRTYGIVDGKWGTTPVPRKFNQTTNTGKDGKPINTSINSQQFTDGVNKK
jgi:hypothetical protein